MSFAIILGIAAVSFANTLQYNQSVRNKNLYKEPSANAYTEPASDKEEEDYTIAAPEENSNREWDISTEQRLRLTLGPYYSKDGKYAAPIIPVYTIQKTRSDTENIVIVICGEGYTESQQQNFSMTSKRCGTELCGTNRIVVMPTALMCTLFVRHRNRVSEAEVVRFSMWLWDLTILRQYRRTWEILGKTIFSRDA